MATHGARFCCVVNCSNNRKTTIDSRTGNPVRFHRFPDPDKKSLSPEEKKTERDRLSKWIVNIGRADISPRNVKCKRVCAVHFELQVYNCPSDPSTSRLLPTAVPTLVNCPNPPPLITPCRPAPKKRQLAPHPSHSIEEPVEPLPLPKTAKLTTEEQLIKAQQEIEKYKSELKHLRRQHAALQLKYEKATARERLYLKIDNNSENKI